MSFPLTTSALLLVAAQIIQYSGNTDIKDTIIRNKYIPNFLILITLITHFHLQECQKGNQNQNQEGHRCRVSEIRYILK